jgi:NAD(P)-dependent dehydrogenase (short-subunit alcohol dehydrogenase family)
MAEQVAIVSGAGRGIGRAIALELARQPMIKLCLCARTPEELHQTRSLSGLGPDRALIVALDLARPEGPRELVEAAMKHFQRVDMLVNNAGWAPRRKALVDFGDAEIDRMVALNLRAPIALTRLVAREMIRLGRPGAIVNIASSAARTAPAKEAIYAATKAGLVAFTWASFAELRSYGIKLAVILPGLVDTSLIPPNRALERSRMLTPQSVAAAVKCVLEASEDACPVEITLEPQYDPMRAGGSR